MDNNFIYILSKKSNLKNQGWKLHVTSIDLDVDELLRKTVPILLSYKCSFKVVRSLEKINQMNSNNAIPRSQVGKFITIYPDNNTQCFKLAWHLHEVTKGLRGPRIVSDRPITKDSLVHYRYGAFKSKKFIDENLQEVEAIENSSGSLERDERKGWYSTPNWVDDCPFEYKDENSSTSLIGTKYKVVKTLTQRAKGGIYLVEDSSRELKVMKEARKFIGNDSLGRDSRHRLRNESFYLNYLIDTKGIPKCYDYFEESGNEYLIMSYMKGKTLRQLSQDWNLKGSYPGIRYGLRIAERLFEIIKSGHDKNVIWRDISPNNIIINNENVNVIDLESLFSRFDNEIKPFTMGTNGYHYLKSESNIKGDFFALGSFFTY